MVKNFKLYNCGTSPIFPQLLSRDRLFRVLLCRFWRHWRELLIIVKPDTVVRWHKQGFRLFWKRKSRHGGRSPSKKEIRDLVRKMARSNPFWGDGFFSLQTPT
jgi:hypothetical protein